MAVEFTTEHKKTNAYTIFPENIVVKPALNGRHEKPDIEWLINDILRHGQHTPVIIRRDGGDAVLVAGFSRWRAISEINKRKLGAVKMAVRCTYVQASEAEGLLINISENRFRNPVSAIDDAHNIKQLLNVYAMSEEDVAGIYFPTAKTAKELKEAAKFVKQRIGLISLSKESAAALKDGRMTETAATAIAKLTQAQQKEVLAKAGDKNKIERKDVVGGKSKAPKGAHDPELLRRVNLLLEDVEGTIDGYKPDDFIEIQVSLVLALRDYIKQK